MSSEPPALCPVCGATEVRTILRAAAHAIVQCCRCRLARTYPPDTVVNAAYVISADMAEQYLKQEPLGRQYSRKFLEFIHDHQPTGRLVDIGCSIGTLVDEANKMGYQAQGVDLDPHAVGIGAAQGRPLAVMDLVELPKGAFQVVCLQHTLEHVSDPRGFLEMCRGLLVSGGTIAISVPCYCGLYPRLLPRRWYGWQPTQHYFHYSRESMRRLLERAGCSGIRVIQNSMDHRVRWDYPQSARGRVVSLLGSTIATCSAAVGMGDQLFAIGTV